MAASSSGPSGVTAPASSLRPTGLTALTPSPEPSDMTATTASLGPSGVTVGPLPAPSTGPTGVVPSTLSPGPSCDATPVALRLASFTSPEIFRGYPKAQPRNEAVEEGRSE
ncbi:hypothetical protein PoB_007468200 [Plakobranchus ocellatus]|uniref:Uncharacterized protein n=1 Tax=Plakobranchus ocellatus TaxID=259542 RepID=A0AAV4DV20_9GAST|nr:hypothetical protein PoB_007468200 [Plakobranchus ocellatus]